MVNKKIKAKKIPKQQNNRNDITLDKSKSYLRVALYSMINRCYDIRNQAYVNYGKRGIEVCDRWQNSLAAFIEDMGERPTNKHSIDRKDNNGNYEPGNCRWATSKEQNNNKRPTKIIYKRNGKTIVKINIDWKN